MVCLMHKRSPKWNAKCWLWDSLCLTFTVCWKSCGRYFIFPTRHSSNMKIAELWTKATSTWCSLL
jgi:hypothetical protein